MIFRLFRSISGFIRPVAFDFCTSVSSGLLLATWLHQSVSLLGTSLAASTSLFLALGLAMAVGLGLTDRLTSARQMTRLESAALPLALMIAGLAGVLSAQLVQIENALLGLAGAFGRWPSIAEQTLIYSAVHSVIVIPVTACLCAATLPLKKNTSATSGPTVTRLSGLTAGVLVAGFAGLPLAGATTTALATGLTAVAMSLSVFALRYRKRAFLSGQTPVPRRALRLENRRLFESLHALLLGIAFGCLSRVLDQLFIDAAWVTVARIAAVMMGITVGSSRLCRKWTVESAAMWIALSCATAIALFPVGTFVSLDISTYLSRIGLIAASRAVIIALTLAPLGVALVLTSSRATNKARLTPLRLTGFVAGIIICQTCLLSTLGPVKTLASVVVALFLSATAQLARHSQRPLLQHKVAFTAALLACLSIPVWSQHYEPERTARLLFDVRIFRAHQIEPRTDILEHLDEARCLSVTEGTSGTLSLWRQQGSQLQIRKSGIPQSAISTDTTLAPQPTGEALQAILPLVFHDRPASILFLGLGTGASVSTALQFPVSRISCAEADAELIQLVCRDIYPEITPNPLQDERVEIIQCDPVLTTALAGTFDLIVCSPGHLSRPESAVQSTADFLSRAAARLNPGGLICQRFRYVDFGVRSVDSLFATWHSVFKHAMAIESAPGELLLIGSIDAAGLFRDGLIDRLQRHHVRHALSASGFDWATPLKLTVFDLNQIHQQRTVPGGTLTELPHIQTAATAAMLSQGPWEVMRWGAKNAEVRQAFRPAARNLSSAFPAAGNDADVQRRLRELNLRRTLIHGKADQYWSYRAEMKRQLKESPRADIVQVKGGGQKTRLHPEEQRRIDYFKALGQAAFQDQPTLDILHPVEEFETPYDPIVSFFMHQEIAELAARNPDANFRLEFHHRLHRVNFTSSQDGSIRNLVATINLLCDHPSLIASPARRGDQLDALLQTLHRRWQNRESARPESTQLAIRDIDQSLLAGERAFALLRELGPERNKHPDEIELRQIALEKSLMRPLQAYRSRLMRRSRMQQAVRRQ